jgi:hypothetical protein
MADVLTFPRVKRQGLAQRAGGGAIRAARVRSWRHFAWARAS